MIIHVEKANDDHKGLNATEHEHFVKILNHFNTGNEVKRTPDLTKEHAGLGTLSKFTVTRKINENHPLPEEENIPIFNVNDVYISPKEDPIITEARDDLIRETLKKEEEVRHKIQLEKEILLQNRLLEMKPKGPINGSKVTFDCNGNVISIGGLNTEKLPNDFVSSR
jgi:hypothetical protein